MAVPADDQSTVRATRHGQHGGLDGKRTAARGEEGGVSADGLGHQILGALQELAAGSAIIEPTARQQVVLERLASQHGQNTVVHPAALGDEPGGVNPYRFALR